MKNTKIKPVALISVIIMVFTASSVSVVAANRETSTQQSEQGSYSAYYEKYKNVGFAEESVTVKLGTAMERNSVSFDVLIPSDALYTAELCYKSEDEAASEIEMDFKIDGANAFTETETLKFPSIWKDAEEKRTDNSGNEYSPKQVPFEGYVHKTANDITKYTDNSYYFYLTGGTHRVTLKLNEGKITLKEFSFAAVKAAEKYQAPKNEDNYKGDAIIVEGEAPFYKTGYWLTSKSDSSSKKVTPNDVSKTLVNYIGGGNWKSTGEEIVWKTPYLKAGNYCLAFSFRQSTVINGKTYRSLKIDGKTPFAEADNIGFKYGDNWQETVFSDDDGNPYRIYFSEGEHEISLTCTPGETLAVRRRLDAAVSKLSELYIDITMITGEKVDSYRDYDLFKQIPDMENSLNEISENLKAADGELERITGRKSGSQSSAVKGMLQVIEQMLANKYSAHRYKNLYYDKYCAVSSVLNELRDMPLDLDKISLFAPNSEMPFEPVTFFDKLKFSVMKFLISFFTDYNAGQNSSERDELTVWVNWGRDQAQILNSMASGDFTAKTGIKVNIKLVSASIVQARLSGKAPDCLLQQSRSEPVNLAMRGVLYDLSQFDDCEDILKRFRKGAEIPYRYRDGVYGIPDTQSFYVMYYRKDILKQMNVEVPETWDELTETAKLLERNNLNIWMSNKAVTDMSQASTGLGSVNIFPSILLQKKLSLYENGGRATALTNPEVIDAFREWTDYYCKLKMPITLDFYNRFRTGTCPIGIEPYTLYTTFTAAAPEIDGLWGISVIPGTRQDDGTISHTSSGAGTAAVILKETKNPNAAWEFLKWWTSAETQFSFSNEAESLLGPTGRVAVANVEAFKKMSWKREYLTPILNAWEQVEEIPEYPGSYYVSRSLYQSFWNVVDSNKNIKDMLLKYGREANEEIERKWKQYEDRE